MTRVNKNMRQPVSTRLKIVRSRAKFTEANTKVNPR